MRRILVPILAALSLLAALRPSVANASNAAEDVVPGVTIGESLDDSTRPSLTSADNRRFCTLAFLVRTSNGGAGALTAGHCVDDAPAWIFLAYSPTDAWRPFGHPLMRAYRDDEGSDVALLAVDQSAGIPVDARVGYKYPVGGWADGATLEAQRPELCAWGAMTGLTCGPFLRVVGGKGQFRAPSRHGDSGAPVFAQMAGGQVAAVGVLDGSPADDGGVITFELIGPWLQRWGLTLL
ncbi:hypothetical protein [Segniliparus rugosus]|uniref:Serine protease n=1 Tax=Segniliparus rugosus (strain ATCC BAA-974 / DSM 45345 / CCUG 50838 / CIP 108380 / JCM 13579 / CDC 945) TaxID=679197 RepID=E5XKQ4_SEGRC|nr:hypothetical protein [Segniliparus rugosus]EFV15070.1 hypothetical protein HMPREF9336_00073 [Segniliparus rugosus ATCC BAA-974]